MSKRSDSKSKRSSKPVPSRTEPWIQQKTGFWIIGVVSLGLAVYVGWQLYPTEGFWRAVLWGGGSAVALWLVFGVSYLINVTVRR